MTAIQSFIVTDSHILSIDRTIRLVASVIFVFLPFIPIPIVAMVLLLKAMSPGGLSKPEILAEGSADPEAAAAPQEKSSADETNTIASDANDNTAVQTAATSAASLSLEKPSASRSPAHSVLTGRPHRKGEPESGFGETPVTRNEILKTAAIIVIPAFLMTFEQGVRTAQAFYVSDGGDIPWVSCSSSVWI